MGRITNSGSFWLDKFIDKHTRTTEEHGEVYLAAGGYYQTAYIAIFEGLTSELDDYVSHDNNSTVDYIAGLFIKELLSRYPDKKLPFNKMVSVTLPSQIIAKAILEKLSRHEDILYYQGNKDSVDQYADKKPGLIRLASYYSFADEIQFKNIVSGDRILVVNDVVSTGGLIDEIYHSIRGLESQNNVHAEISLILSVVDCRVRLNKPASEKLRPSKFFAYEDFNEEAVVSLAHAKIEKYVENPHPDKKLVRINPILNSRITMKSRHSEDDKIAYQDADKFLSLLPASCLQIGHFAQNSLHHSFFLTPAELFSNHDLLGNLGIKLIEDIVAKIERLEGTNGTAYYIKSINNQLGYLGDTLSELKYEKTGQYNTFKEELAGYLVEIGRATEIKPKKNKAPRLIKEDDFVFYPVFSGIEQLHPIDIQEIFKIDYSNIIALQRFDTNKGWRFIIPQKSYNQRLKGKSAVIIDMGSFTGDSIIQMIDALCVFELKKIIVISLIGRLEDFDREFFSRIQEMKVKLLKDETENDNLNDAASRLAPVKIYFGVNFHIPPSLSSKVCEHCNEIGLLTKRKGLEIFAQTPAIHYIKKRIEDLELVHVSSITKQLPPYFPVCWNGTKDMKHFFSTRNHLGKIDGYRFYADYYDYFDDLKITDKQYDQNLESIIAICLHENHLLKTIHNQLPDVKQKIKLYVSDVINGRTNVLDLYYKWDILLRVFGRNTGIKIFFWRVIHIFS